jgi:uncharacterized membrane protein
MPTFLSATRLSSLWGRLHTSFWFLPAAMSGVAVALSIVLVQFDVWLGVGVVPKFNLLYTFGPEGARAILSVIASSMITVASLIFSITMLTLQLASSQFGPRVLRNFMRDRSNQIVLGTFIATFLYCLLVLRTVRGTEESSFVPHLSVAFGALLAIASVAVLIYFIHHIATSIRIETLLANLAAETRSAVDRLYPERMSQDPSRNKDETVEHLMPGDFERGARHVHADSSGYVQRIGVDALMQIATEHHLVVRIEARPGRFVSKGDAMLSAYPRDRVSDEIANDLGGALVIGLDRTPEQDLEFSIRRIVELAQRSLSSGINDPTTALYCIDRLGEVFGRLADREIPSPMRFDEKRQLRIVTEINSLGDLACHAFAAIARYGITDVDVIARLLSSMDILSRSSPREACDAIMGLREAIRRESENHVSLAFDREAVKALPESHG